MRRVTRAMLRWVYSQLTWSIGVIVVAYLLGVELTLSTIMLVCFGGFWGHIVDRIYGE